MTKAGLPAMLLLLLLSSCKDKRKIELANSIRQLKNTISFYKHDLQDRGAFLENNQNLNEEKKRQYRYNNLLQVQQRQEARMAELQKQLNFFETLYNKGYKK